MQLLDRIRSHPLPAAVLAGALLGLVVGLAIPIQASAPNPAEVSAWADRGGAVTARFDEARFARVRDAAPWTGGAASVAGSGAVPWRLAGIILDPAPRALVYGKEKDRALRLQVGDALPDGGKVVEITARSVRFTRAGCTFERALYSANDQALTADCTPR